jgi:hypothetical protein
MATYPPALIWRFPERGVHVLLYEGKEVGRAWVPMRLDRGRKPRGAWSAGNEELGIPDSGVQEADSLEDARVSCHVWVIRKGKLPPGPAPALPDSS